MALGRYTRIDNKRSSWSSCWTVMTVTFVGLCLVGVWMMTSSFVVPGQNINMPAEENKNEVKELQVSNEDDSTKQFENSPGDSPIDAKKGDNNGNVQENLVEKPEVKDEENSEKKVEEKPREKGQGDIKTDDGPNVENQSSDTQDGKTGLQDEWSKPDDMQGNSAENVMDNDSSNTVETERTPVSEVSKNKVNTDGTNINLEENSGEMKAGDAKNGSDLGVNEKAPVSDEAEKKTDTDGADINSDENSGETKDGNTGKGQLEEKVDQNENKEPKESSSDQVNVSNPSAENGFPSGAQSELLNETTTQNGSWKTQAAESKDEKESRQPSYQRFDWKLCNVTAGPDYIPCLDNWKAIKSLPTTKHYEHRERHCPKEPPTCLVPLPEGYKRPIEWPKSRGKIWYNNVPHTKLAEIKGHQNWVKVTGKYLTFPGGGTQFKEGALRYIDFINEAVPDIAWGKRSRVVLDVGCGVASFGGFLNDRNVLTMSLAPKDEHEAQVQFALERGIPAILAVMGTKRLPFPSAVFDVVHCARCRVPWHIDGGILLLELNRVLRPGGFFVWSATPVYRKSPEDVGIWKAMTGLLKSMCWEAVSIAKDKVNRVGIATYRKPVSNDCYEKRSQQEPPICEASDDPNAAWNVPLQACMHKVTVDTQKRGSQWPELWPVRLEKAPYWMQSSQVGVYGKPEPEDFASDHEHWKRVVSESYLNGMGINWSIVRNVMDMRAIYGGFAAALKDMNVWVLNVVPIDSPDTLPIIHERGLFGMYHDWCESFSTYPRSYDLLHADHLFSKIKQRCNLVALVAEVDRILRPEGKLIVRDDVETINELENMARSLQWQVRMTYSTNNEGLLCVEKSMWRPKESETLAYAIA